MYTGVNNSRRPVDSLSPWQSGTNGESCQYFSQPPTLPTRLGHAGTLRPRRLHDSAMYEFPRLSIPFMTKLGPLWPGPGDKSTGVSGPEELWVAGCWLVGGKARDRGLSPVAGHATQARSPTDPHRGGPSRDRWLACSGSDRCATA